MTIQQKRREILEKLRWAGNPHDNLIGNDHAEREKQVIDNALTALESLDSEEMKGKDERIKELEKEDKMKELKLSTEHTSVSATFHDEADLEEVLGIMEGLLKALGYCFDGHLDVVDDV